MPAPLLPRDVIFSVLDHSDSSTLASLARVCDTDVQRAATHKLYSDVYLNTPEALTRFASDNTLKWHARSVKRLRIGGGVYAVDRSRPLTGSEAYPWMGSRAGLIARALRLFENLQELWVDIGQKFQFVCLESTSAESSKETESTQRFCFPRLRSLGVHSIEMVHFFEVPDLRSLHLESFKPRYSSYSSSPSDKLHSVTHLTLPFAPSSGVDPMWFWKDRIFNVFPSLKAVTICVKAPFRNPVKSITSLPELTERASVTLKQISELRVVLDPALQSHMEALAVWKSTEHLLFRHLCPNLRSFSLSIGSS